MSINEICFIKQNKYKIENSFSSMVKLMNGCSECGEPIYEFPYCFSCYCCLVLDKLQIPARKEIIVLKLGATCFFVNFESFSNSHAEKLYAHKKDYKTHKRLRSMSKDEFSKIDWLEYVRVCHFCHGKVHWLFKVFGMSWEEIICRLF